MTDQIIMFISQLFNGLKIGSVYALVALGYTMVYGIIRLINFAHGDFIMVGAYVLMLTIPAIVAMGLPAWVAVIPAILVCVAVGVIVEKAAYKPVREKGNSMTALITAIAMSLLLENGSQAIFGADFQTVPTIFHLPSIAFGKLKLPGDTLLTIVIGLVIMVGLQLFVKFTRQGKAMRAVSEDKEAAVLMGINVNSTIALTFAIGSGLAAVASLMYCARLPAGLAYDGRHAGPEGVRRRRARRHWFHPGRHDRWSGHRSDRKPDQGVYRHHHGGHHHLGVLRRHRVRHPDHRAARQTVRHYGQERRGEGLIR